VCFNLLCAVLVCVCARARVVAEISEMSERRDGDGILTFRVLNFFFSLCGKKREKKEKKKRTPRARKKKRRTILTLAIIIDARG